MSQGPIGYLIATFFLTRSHKATKKDALFPLRIHTNIPILLSTNFLSTEGTKKHERENRVLFRVFRVFRVFRGPSPLYSCRFVVLDSRDS